MQEPCGELIKRSDVIITDFEIVMCNGDYKEALKILLEKIEKAPTVDVLDKIRAEIEQVEINGYIRDVECFRAGINIALNVIDKYKAERSE